MNSLTKKYLNYLTQDCIYIRDNELSNEESKKLVQSSWLHQLVLAPLVAGSLAATCIHLSTGEYINATVGGFIFIPSYSIYARYGLRRMAIYLKKRKIKESNLEAITQQPIFINK